VTLALLPPGAEPDDAADALDARLVIDAASVDGGPPTAALPRDTRGAPTPTVRFLLQTSGTTGARRGIALSDDNVRAVLESHAPAHPLTGATVLYVLPWHHAVGLVIQLLPALLAGATLVREPSAGRDPASLLAAAAAHGATHLDAVPHTVRLLAAHGDGRAMLARLRGGVVGGAPVDAPLADVLARTRLRVGYGQTEASPGIALGAPGEWRAGLLGRPLGCAVRVDDDGVLAFRGPNACVGTWSDGALHPLRPDRWVRTGDLARQEADGTLLFDGRLADSFKLANGRYVAAAAIEAAVRARFPQVQEALLSSPDGDALVLALGGSADDVSVEAVRPLLGGLSTRPLRLVRVAPDAWLRTPKGELDRRHPTGRAGS
jgi:long-subunit acyl-CoA synthetase (AMP-forming)